MLDPHLNLFFRYGSSGNRGDSPSLRDLEDNVTRAFVTSLSCIGSGAASNVIRFLYSLHGWGDWVPSDLDSAPVSFHLHRGREYLEGAAGPKASLLCICEHHEDPAIDAKTHGCPDTSVLDAVILWRGRLAVGVESKVTKGRGQLDHTQIARHLEGLSIEGVDPASDASPQLVRVTWEEVARAFDSMELHEECGRSIARHFCQYLSLVGLSPDLFDPVVMTFLMEEMACRPKPALLRMLQAGFRDQFEAMARRIEERVAEAGLSLERTAGGAKTADNARRAAHRSGAGYDTGFSVRIPAVGMPQCKWRATLWPDDEENMPAGLAVSLYTESTAVEPPFTRIMSAERKVESFRLKVNTREEWNAVFDQQKGLLKAKASEIASELARRARAACESASEPLSFSLSIGRCGMKQRSSSWQGPDYLGRIASIPATDSASWACRLEEAIDQAFSWPDFPDTAAMAPGGFSLEDYKRWREASGAITKPYFSLHARLPEGLLARDALRLHEVARIMTALATGR